MTGVRKKQKTSTEDTAVQNPQLSDVLNAIEGKKKQKLKKNKKYKKNLDLLEADREKKRASVT